jgi:hypothetical protein
MNIHGMNSTQVMVRLESAKDYLDQIVRSGHGDGVSILSVSKLSDQDAKNNIFRINLNHSLYLVIKLGDEKKLRNELNGMQYASQNGVPNPGVFSSQLSAENPVGIPFFLMGYVATIPFRDIIAGNLGQQGCVGDRKEPSYSNSAALDIHFEQCLPIIRKLHHPTGRHNYCYQRDISANVFITLKKMIDEIADTDCKEAYFSWLKSTLDLYTINRDVFTSSREVHLHGDLSPSNLCHTTQGIVLIDWEYYQLGDSAVDTAYFAEKNFLIDSAKPSMVERLVSEYSGEDPSFRKRFLFQTALIKIRESLAGYISFNNIQQFMDHDFKEGFNND